MALVTEIKPKDELEPPYVKKNRETHKTKTECKYFFVITEDGNKYLQLNTVGSPDRKKKGAESQTIQFSSKEICQLKNILHEYELLKPCSDSYSIV